MENLSSLYLVKVEPNANNNKFYRMIQLNESTFTAEYGRIGNSGFQTRSYSMSQWDKKLREKIKKGYADQTRLVAEPVIKEKNKYKEIENTSIKAIVDRLQAMARQAIKDNYTISSSKVTQVMIDEAQNLINLLLRELSIDKFNEILVDLFQVIPRKMGRVKDYLAKDKNDISNILQREQDLLDVMKGQVVQENLSNNSEEDKVINDKTILEIMGLTFDETTKEEDTLIKQKLGDIKDKFYQAWKVSNIRTQKQFDGFVKENKINNIKLLWHGSRNENFWSIINNGLVLRPNAIITGKLYGKGIYFAPKARKSFGYTSYENSCWAGGHSNFAFMSLFEVAYGNSYDVYDFDSKYYNLNYDNLQKFKPNSHCLHAHAGANIGYSRLRNDEIIVYKEEQLTIKYLIELR